MEPQNKKCDNAPHSASPADRDQPAGRMPPGDRESSDFATGGLPTHVDGIELRRSITQTTAPLFSLP
jgi:hypothetical protein